MPPSAGTIDVLGHEATGSLAERTSVRRLVGYLPQELTFPRGMTAFSFLDYVAVLKEWTERAARHAEVRRVLEHRRPRGSRQQAGADALRRAAPAPRARAVADRRSAAADPRRADDRARPGAARVAARRCSRPAGTSAPSCSPRTRPRMSRRSASASSCSPTGACTSTARSPTSSPPRPARCGCTSARSPARASRGAPAPGRIRSIGGTPPPAPRPQSRPSRTPTC